MASQKRNRQRNNRVNQPRGKAAERSGQQRSLPQPASKPKRSWRERLIDRDPPIHQGEYEIVRTSRGVRRVLYPTLGALLFLKHSTDMIPEPFNLGAHIGNMSVSAGIGAAVAGIRTPELLDRSRFITDHPTRMRAAMMTAAAGAGLAINALVETKWGIETPLVHAIYENPHIPGPNLTPDTLDLVYGGIGAMLGTYAVEIKPNHLYKPPSAEL